MIKNFYLFRHGQTEWNKDKRIQGLADNPLNPSGIQQAKELIPLLRPHNLDIIISSTLRRARDTADIVAKALNIPVITDQRLVEIDLGDYDGHTLEDVRKIMGKEFIDRYLGSMKEEDMYLKLPGGESKKSAQERTITALKEAAASDAVNIGVACHGLIITLVLGYTGTDMTYPLANGDVAHIQYNGKQFKLTDYTPNPVNTGRMY